MCLGIAHLPFVAPLQISCPIDKTSLLTLTFSVSPSPDNTIFKNLSNTSGITSSRFFKYSAEGGHGILSHLVKESLMDSLKFIATWDILSLAPNLYASRIAYTVSIALLKTSCDEYFPLPCSKDVNDIVFPISCFRSFAFNISAL